MVRLFLICSIFITMAFSARVEEYQWEKGETLLMFLQKNSLPASLYYSLDNEDKELAFEIYAGVKYYLLKDDSGEIRQILIPVGGGELQLHIYKAKEGNYTLEIIPISYQEEDKELVFELETSPYQDIMKLTNSNVLAHEFVSSFQGSVDFSRLRAGTKVVILYKQKIRLGTHFTNPTIKAAMVDNGKREDFVFFYEPKGRYYNNDGKEIEGYFLMMPVKFSRISSGFSLKRWHPILKKYRAHLGIDYAAPLGTHVKAAGDGKVTFVGTMNGYGKTVKVAHEGGYMTLYGHLNGYASGISSGKRVKKGQLIAYVGNTGYSTGPHLHLGLYHNNRPINPNSVIKVAKSALNGEEKKAFGEYTASMREQIQDTLKVHKLPVREEPFVYVVAAPIYTPDE